MEEFQIYRELDEPIDHEDLDAAADESGRALEEMREEGTDIRWNESEVLTNAEGDVIGTFCQYEAESEAAVEEHAERAGLPATTIARRGSPLEGE